MDLSALYFDILKDRLYTARANGKGRRSAQTVLHGIAADLLRILAPVMSFTAEEAWKLLPGAGAQSVFFAGLPPGALPTDPGLMTRYGQLFALRSEVQKHLEGARRDKLIGASLEAKVILSADGAAADLIRTHLAELPALFITSQVEFAPPSAKAQPLAVSGGFPAGDVRAEVLHADGHKCPRCWTYSEAVGNGGDVCLKCREALA